MRGVRISFTLRIYSFSFYQLSDTIYIYSDSFYKFSDPINIYALSRNECGM